MNTLSHCSYSYRLIVKRWYTRICFKHFYHILKVDKVCIRVVRRYDVHSIHNQPRAINQLMEFEKHYKNIAKTAIALQDAKKNTQNQKYLYSIHNLYIKHTYDYIYV